MEEIFSTTKFVSVSSVGGLLKRSSFTGYAADNSTVLWSATGYGGGVIVLGVSGSRFPVNFKTTKKKF